MADPFWSVCSVFVNLLAKTTGEPRSPFLMSAVDGLYVRWRKIFESDENTPAGEFLLLLEQGADPPSDHRGDG